MHNGITEVPVERALADLMQVIKTLREKMLPYFEGDADALADHSFKNRLASFRRVLIFQVNSILDEHGANPGGDGFTRAGITFDMITEDLKDFGIVKTPDGKMFTFEKAEDAAIDA